MLPDGSRVLVVLDLVWVRELFVVPSVMLVAANVDTVRRSRGGVSASRSTLLGATEIVGTAAVVVLVVLHWALGGFHPTRGDLTWAILLAFAA
jgi:hypothetical protein